MSYRDLGQTFDTLLKYPATGMALHYPIIYALMRGLNAKSVFEFGAGQSTNIIHVAMEDNVGGKHVSCSTDPFPPPWIDTNIHTHLQGQSVDVVPKFLAEHPDLTFDFVLHDGSHTREVVAADLRAILPRVKQYGMIAVHDSLHSKQGEAVSRGIFDATDWWLEEMMDLPFGFGLMLMVMYSNAHLGHVEVETWRKIGSPHYTKVL